MTRAAYLQSLTVHQLRIRARRNGVTILQSWTKPQLITAIIQQSNYHAERTVVVYNDHGHAVTVAKYHAAISVAERKGWRPGVTHSKWVGKTRYTFHDGCTSSRPCSTSKFVSR